MCEGGGVPAPSLLLYVCLIYVMYLCVCLAGCVYPWAVGSGVCVCARVWLAPRHVCVRVLLGCVCGQAVCPHDCLCHACGRHLCKAGQAFSKACARARMIDEGSRCRLLRGGGWQWPVPGEWAQRVQGAGLPGLFVQDLEPACFCNKSTCSSCSSITPFLGVLTACVCVCVCV